MSPKPTRTIGPLHFEDLEPHRFEDLIRQLVYDFKQWRQLEPTGRVGADDGFDARGWEITSHEGVPEPNDEEIVDGNATQGEDRIWLIQCKREKAIGPKQLGAYLDDIPEEERKALYGLILAAPVNFSKAAYDLFRQKTREFGLSEAPCGDVALWKTCFFSRKTTICSSLTLASRFRFGAKR